MKHLYDSIEFTVIAESLAQAQEKWDEWTGIEKEYYDDDEWKEVHNIRQIPDEKEFAFFIEDELEIKPEGVVIDGCKWRATARAWADAYDVGFFASAEF